MRETQTSSAFERLIEHLTRLPGIGKRSAQRIAFHLVRESADEAFTLADAIRAFKTDLKACSVCGNVTESDPCPICSDSKRDRTRILVVEQPNDVITLEQTGVYHGLYHVLMGRLAPLDGISPGELNVDSLIARLRDGTVREVILGTNATMEGDGTALYLHQQLEKRGVHVSRLARGLPTGSNLNTLSKAVLADAIQARHNFGTSA